MDVVTSPRRVKIYILKNNEWLDNGTGYCVGHLNSNSPCLVVNDEVSEAVLLNSSIKGNIEYQKQDDTLIVWKDDVLQKDIALSFEESDGCEEFCQFLVEVFNKKINPNISLVSIKNNGADNEMIVGSVNLPDNISEEFFLKEDNDESMLELLRILCENTSFLYLKERSKEWVFETNLIQCLVNVFEKIEKKNNIKKILIINTILKTLILYNDRNIIEKLVENDTIFDTILGILEYDTESPDFKANHKYFFTQHQNNNNVEDKELLKFIDNNNIQDLIKKSIKLKFLKDVVLVRFFDDNNYNLITDILIDYESILIKNLQNDLFFDKLIKLYSNETSNDNDEQNKLNCQNGIRFLHQCIQLTKNLSNFEKSVFYKHLVAKGFFKIIKYAFNNENVDRIRILATDSLVTIMEHDLFILFDNDLKHNTTKTTCTNNNDGGDDDNKDDTSKDTSIDMTLLQILYKILIIDKSPGLKEQVVQALYTILNPIGCIDNIDNDGGIIERDYDYDEYNDNEDYFLREKNKTNTFPLMEYLSQFYKEIAPNLFEPLIKLNLKDEQLLVHLVNLITFIATEHDRHLSRKFILENNILESINNIIENSDEYNIHIIVASLQCFKKIIFLNDNFYMRYIISKNLLKSIIELLMKNNGMNNLINSSIQDFFHKVLLNCRENINNYLILNKYLFQKFDKEFKNINDIPFLIELAKIK